MEFTQEWIREYTEFSEEKKTLVWKKSPSYRAPVGTVVGAISNSGYRRTRNMLVHRLVWLYFHGSLPNGILDHIDGNKLNNSINNLRIVTQLQNNHNRHNVRGYTFDKSKGKYKSSIRDNYKQKHLGLFDTPEEAQAAYFKAKQERDSKHG